MLHDVMNQVWHNTNFIDSQFLGKDPLNDSEDFGSPDLAASAAPDSSQLFPLASNTTTTKPSITRNKISRAEAHDTPAAVQILCWDLCGLTNDKAFARFNPEETIPAGSLHLSGVKRQSFVPVQHHVRPGQHMITLQNFDELRTFRGR